MKYLDYPLLSELSSSLSNDSGPDVKLNVRIEAYSVKPIGKEKKMFKNMEEAYVSEQEELAEMSFSPEMRQAGLGSCFGRLDEKESRKVHWLLVSTLNSAFPDNDYSSLRPEQFTREPSAVDVVNYVSSQLIGPSGKGGLIGPITSPPQGSSPLDTSPNPTLGNLSMFTILNDIVPFDECEVYSWFPEPEYDPHAQSDDPTDDEVEELQDEDSAESMELDEPSWGHGGMELDDVPPLTGSSRRYSHPTERIVTPVETLSPSDRIRGLLWSANYFFYNRRHKKIVFLTCWCRKRPSAVSTPLDADPSTFPLPLAASYSGPPSVMDFKVPRGPRRSTGKHLQRRSRQNLKGDLSSTIPIRQPETPRATRFASSAPSVYSPLHASQSPSAAFAKMNAGGFRPKQTPARSMMHAAKEAEEAEQARIRKERSESTTPGPSSGLSSRIKEMAKKTGVEDSTKGKRLRV